MEIIVCVGQVWNPRSLLVSNLSHPLVILCDATDTGFKIFNCDPFKETFQRDFNKGGIGHGE